MGTLDVDPSRMKGDAEAFTTISDAADEITSYMRNALHLLGEFWGNDKVGDTFIAQWSPSVNGLLEAFTGVGSGMRLTAGGINDSADLYIRSNEVNTELAR
jgi:hypothetical protein